MSRLTLSQCVQEWLDTHIETTRTTYSAVMKDVIKFLGNRPLDQVTPHDLNLYIQFVTDRDTVKSTATINKHIITVKAWGSWCVKEEILESDPARRLKRLNRSKRIRREKAMSDEELQIVLKYCRKQINKDTIDWRGLLGKVEHYRNYALITFLADSGCRVGGARILKLTDLDLDEKTALVTQKGNKTMTVVFGDETAHAIRTWLHKRSEWLQQEGYALKDMYIFQRHGELMTRRSISQAFRRVCKRAGIRSLGPHSLRHRKGHQLQKVVDPVTAAIALGHSSPDITMQFYYDADRSFADATMRDLAIDSSMPSPNEPTKQMPADNVAPTDKNTSSKIIDLSDYLAG